MGQYTRGTNEELQSNDAQQARHGFDFYDDAAIPVPMCGLIPLEDGCTFTAFNARDGKQFTTQAVPKDRYLPGHFFNITVVGLWMGIKADPNMKPANEAP